MLTSEEKARLLELIGRVEKAEKCCDPEHAVYDTEGNLDFDATCRECPYKGEECDGEKDPRRRDTLEVFRLARKAAEEEPARLLTAEEELRSLPIGAVIWLESKGEDIKGLRPLVREFGECFANSCDIVFIKDEQSLLTRIWSAKPTCEQMMKTPWPPMKSTSWELLLAEVEEDTDATD